MLMLMTWKVEEWPVGQGMWAASRSWKVNTMGSFLEPTKWKVALLNTLLLAQRGSCWIATLQSHKIKHFSSLIL